MDTITSLLIYIITFGSSMFFAKLYQKKNRRKRYRKIFFPKKVLWFLIIMFPPILISTIRYNVGTDYFNYIEQYNRIINWPFDAVWSFYGNEPLYLYLNVIANQLFESVTGFFFLSSLIINILVIAGLDFYKKYISISMGLFIYYAMVFNFGLNGVRQMIAMAVVFYAIKFIIQRKPFRYVMSIILATLFHNTAILCLMFYIVALRKKNPRMNTVLKRLFYLAIIFTPIILAFGIDVLSGFSLFSKYADDIYSDGVEIKIGFLLNILPLIVPLFLLKRNVDTYNFLGESLIDLTLFNIPFQYIGYYIEWGYRMMYYTQFIYFITIPFVLSSIKNKKEKVIAMIYYLSYFLYWYILRYIILNSSEAFPFNTIF